MPAERQGLALRVLRFPVTLIVIEAVVFGVIGLPLDSIPLIVGNRVSGPILLLGMVVALVIFILLWKAFRRWVEGQRDREFELTSSSAPEAGAGLLAGFALFCLMTGLVALLGGIAVTGVRSFGATQFWIWAALGLASGIVEETLFRGILLRQLERLVGTWWALALTSILFGALHLTNPDATWAGALGIMLEAGILLGAAYLYTRRLWLAAGMHAAWNFTQAWVFSVPVSGTGETIGILATERHGPEWLTGGKFGLEASAAAVVVATGAGLLLLWGAWRKGGFVAPIWQRPRAA